VLSVIIIASGGNGRQRAYGHHAPHRWHAAGTDRTEITISARLGGSDPGTSR
jgi:hypothetical protein